MPLLGALVQSLFGGLAAWLAQFFGRKISVIAVAVGALAAINVALLVTFRTLVTPLVQSAFSTQYGQFIGLAFPPAAGNCLAVIAACWAACALYRWQRAALAISVQA